MKKTIFLTGATGTMGYAAHGQHECHYHKTYCLKKEAAP